jgi:hypothetical protein
MSDFKLPNNLSQYFTDDQKAQIKKGVDDLEAADTAMKIFAR